MTMSLVGWSHLEATINTVPDWWGITVNNQGWRSYVALDQRLRIQRSGTISISAKLLWRDEAPKLWRP